ncbi:MAG: cysteine hydrolase [Phenylobacterium sp.]|uniref:cysteine hydrolase family protein n=1 Tax=Phenylobacterium sp. TaxID=1871053 RepID=UPI002734EB81|nr:cysteine hydrolase [Phenylobacterium sp.]MDP1641891.1 cysteine hydrolase [Phenylobacterium sp.]MDP3117776.1 cysteine hydrolase [Phenylobacterium sp.]
MSALAAPVQADDGLATWIAPARTALVIIDMQVDFAAPEGRLGQWGVDLSTVPPALEKAQALADAARKAGAPVVFVGLFTRPETDSSAWRERMRRRGGDPDSDSGLCRAGEVGSDWHGPKPLPGEAVVEKARYSGFHDAPLDSVLKGLGVDTLVVAGLTTECCVDCTVRDAFHLDYHVFLASDACAAYEAEVHAASLKALELNCAILVETDQVITAWEEAA